MYIGGIMGLDPSLLGAASAAFGTLSGIPGVGPLFGGISGALGAGANMANADRNFELQQAQFEYMKAMQQQSWAREDNAVQRRVADMKAAGINPLLAAGSPAAASSPVNIAAPQRGAADLSGVQNGLLLANQIRASKAQADLAETSSEEAKYNLSKWKDSGMPSNAGQFAGLATAIQSLGRALGVSVKDFPGAIVDTVVPHYTEAPTPKNFIEKRAAGKGMGGAKGGAW